MKNWKYFVFESDLINNSFQSTGTQPLSILIQSGLLWEGGHITLVFSCNLGGDWAWVAQGAVY